MAIDGGRWYFPVRRELFEVPRCPVHAAGDIMKIEKKLILSNIINGAFIILIGFFAFQNLNLVLTKLRFVQIAE